MCLQVKYVEIEYSVKKIKNILTNWAPISIYTLKTVEQILKY